MKKSRTKKALIATEDVADERSQQVLALETAEPDSVRDSVREGLSQLSEEQRRAAHSVLLSALKGAGVNIGHHLLLLGIPARTAEELTAAEMGILIRYVRISEPRAMGAVAPVLVDVLAEHARPARRVTVSRRAA